MKKYPLLVISLLTLLISCKGNSQQKPENSLNCSEYWANVRMNDFCGLAAGHFKFNTIPVDICNADQNDDTYPFDDLVSIRVYNHFSEVAAKQAFNQEEADAVALGNYLVADDIGDDGFALISVQFGELDSAIIQTVKGTFTVYVEVNGKAHNGARNCFDKDTVLEFAKALVHPL